MVSRDREEEERLLLFDRFLDTTFSLMGKGLL